MTRKTVNSEIEKLKQDIIKNVAVNDEIISSLCEELILLATQQEDWQSVAFGYIWIADYQFYVIHDLKEVIKILATVDRFLDFNDQNELLEKYYTLKYLSAEGLFDMQSCFSNCLKALEVATCVDIKERIVANSANIGAYFMDSGCYHEALFYTNEALSLMDVNVHPKMSRVMLVNQIKAYTYMGQFELAFKAVETLTQLPLPEEDLALFVDYGKILYYSRKGDKAQSLIHVEALFEDGIMQLSSRKYITVFLMDSVEALLLIHHQASTLMLLKTLRDFLLDEESQPLMALCDLYIRYAKQFNDETHLEVCYRAYCQLAIVDRFNLAKLSAEGLKARIQLQESDLMTAQSIHELKRLQDLADFDALTGVYNRHSFNKAQSELLNQGQVRVGCLLFDLDYFKEYNDNYGHMAGDEALCLVAACLLEASDERITVYRYGGDEFVCLAKNDACDYMANYVSKVQARLEERNIEHLFSLCANHLTLSIGYGCEWIENRMTLYNLIKTVDQALYIAKKKGRNNAQSVQCLAKDKEESCGKSK